MGDIIVWIFVGVILLFLVCGSFYALYNWIVFRFKFMDDKAFLQVMANKYPDRIKSNFFSYPSMKIDKIAIYKKDSNAMITINDYLVYHTNYRYSTWEDKLSVKGIWYITKRMLFINKEYRKVMRHVNKAKRERDNIIMSEIDAFIKDDK